MHDDLLNRVQPGSEVLAEQQNRLIDDVTKFKWFHGIESEAAAGIVVQLYEEETLSGITAGAIDDTDGYGNVNVYIYNGSGSTADVSNWAALPGVSVRCYVSPLLGSNQIDSGKWVECEHENGRWWIRRVECN